MSEVILRANGILKRYGGHTALDRIDFALYRNTVNVLIGENGAGKSTLMRILSGVEMSDEGTIFLDGTPIDLSSPRKAAAYGIGIVHQELSVLPNLDISENVFAGRELTRNGLVDRSAEDVRAANAIKKLRKILPVNEPTSQLSLGNRQVVELARAIDHGASILILDEPTSALSIAEADSLFEVIEELKRAGVTIVYISHRLHELLHIGDHFTVLRCGKVVGEAPRAEVTRQWIVERMSGRADTSDMQPRTMTSVTSVLTVDRLTLDASAEGEEAQTPLRGISLTLHHGEILGIYGLLGAGRTELLETLAGGRDPVDGLAAVNGTTLPLNSVESSVKAGVVLVPEDRQRDGLIPELSIRENIALSSRSGLFFSKAQETERAMKLVKDLNIAVHDLELPVTALSGGNQQKVLIARCLMLNPSVLLLDEPTRGVDVGAKAEIYRILRRLAAEGLSILFTSSEIEETRTLADRILVLCQGEVAAEFTHDQLTDEALFASASPKVSTTETAA